MLKPIRAREALVPYGTEIGPLLKDTTAEWQGRVLRVVRPTGAYVRPEGAHEGEHRATLYKICLEAPDALALVCAEQALTYQDLNHSSNQLAHWLQKWVQPESKVAICLPKSVSLIVAVLAVLKAGGAGIVFDPDSSESGATNEIGEGAATVILSQSSLSPRFSKSVLPVIYLDVEQASIAREPSTPCSVRLFPENIALAIARCDPCGRGLQGALLTHQGLATFVRQIDEQVQVASGSAMLALSRISAQNALLEWLWVLSRGGTILFPDSTEPARMAQWLSQGYSEKSLQFSLFYFDGKGETSAQDKYRLLIDGARFADEHGFAAVWTPERHFDPFGGIYPNPSVTAAALSMITKRIHLRAGSVVAPLHEYARIAEEWSVVDNLSGGRVGVSFASGWHVNDFVLSPSRYNHRKEEMIRAIHHVRNLWRGESSYSENGAGKSTEITTYPRPLQQELPTWVTCSGNPETFEIAGRLGAGVLTHLLGQTTEELAEKIKCYRQAWARHGYAGAGNVTLMIHTFLGRDAEMVREKVRGPFCEYLAGSLGLVRKQLQASRSGAFSDDQIPWQRPASLRAARSPQALEFRPSEEADTQELLSHAFDRYFNSAALFGAPETCLPMLRYLDGIGVDEIASLVDFGVDRESVVVGFEQLNRLKELYKTGQEKSAEVALAKKRIAFMQADSLGVALSASRAHATTIRGSLDTFFITDSNAARVSEYILRNKFAPNQRVLYSLGDAVLCTSDAVSMHLLNEKLEPIREGMTGTIYLPDRDSRRADLKGAEETAQCTVPDPSASAAPGARLCKTAWQARLLGNQEVQLLESQMRREIVLGDRLCDARQIERVIEQHPNVQEATVVACHEPASEETDESYLVSFFVPAISTPEVSLSELRRFVGNRIGPALVPAGWVRIDSLARLSSGETDLESIELNRLCQAYWDRQLMSYGVSFGQRNGSQSRLYASCPSFTLDTTLWSAVQELSVRTDSTCFLILLAAFHVLIQAQTGRGSVRCGVPLRVWQTSETGTGKYAVKTFPFGADFADDPTVVELLQRERESALGAFSHKEISEALLSEKFGNHVRAWSFVFLEDSDLETTDQQLDHPDQPSVELMLQVRKADRITAAFRFDPGFYHEEVVTSIQQRYFAILEGIVRDPARTVSQLISGPSKKHLLCSFNQDF